MDQESDPQFRVISAVPVALLLAALIETLLRPQPGGSYALLALVLASPLLVAWLVWRLRQGA